MATLLEQIEEIDCIHKLYAVDLTITEYHMVLTLEETEAFKKKMEEIFFDFKDGMTIKNGYIIFKGE